MLNNNKSKKLAQIPDRPDEIEYRECDPSADM
jgi:hypothetical protein